MERAKRTGGSGCERERADGLRGPTSSRRAVHDPHLRPVPASGEDDYDKGTENHDAAPGGFQKESRTGNGSARQ